MDYGLAIALNYNFFNLVALHPNYFLVIKNSQPFWCNRIF
ncbi:hypothetical protein GXM_00659 [Nostoc sphaeroides CCNUC1]|uniref:Uncharacterized protein n=1 Tax=Nostoc sphaeroides CCNUC1 TaxID=2653204 RepID=A0A5P8VSK6_9NOSO|nr:hypothetical protein GXM_00659 [Nostoc sphaeroides CCNUC1]